MDRFDFVGPVRVRFGPGTRRELGEALRGKYRRVLLVCAKGPFRTNGVFRDVRTSLAAASIDVVEMEDIDSNPRIESVERGAAICRREEVDCVVALGGGSTIDCSKVIAATAVMGGDPRRFLWGEKVPITGALDSVVVPTFAATGTELNDTAVILDPAAVSKSWCGGEPLFPKLAVIDPEIAAAAPYAITSWGCMDILSHTFEFYFNGRDDVLFQVRFSEALLLSAMECLERLKRQPKDVHARGELAWISVMAWGGLTKIGRGPPDMACHTIAEGLVPYFDIHHGASLGVITPRWMRFAAQRVPAPFARFARNVMGVSEANDARAATAGVERYVAWLRSVDAPGTLPELTGAPIPRAKLREIAVRVARENEPVGRLIRLGVEEIESLYQASCEPL